MAQSWKATHRWIERVFWLSITGATAPLLIESVVRGGDRAFAQIVPDNTLGVEQSIVTSSHTVRGLPGVLIEGGARRGTSLFQSFSDFNVGNGQRVYFASPAGVENILSRVTGRNPSSISGTLGVDGTANLFLLNPRGILFGPNARLDVAGSFVASTADRLDFGNGLSFSATNPEAPPPLTVSLRPGLQYGTNYQGEISSAGHLAVGAGQILTLAGQSVTVTGSLSTPGGTVQVLGDRIALSDHARINVSGSNGGNVFIGGSFQGNGSLPNAQQTTIGPNVLIQADGIGTGLEPSSFQHGGNVIVWADGITRFYGTITARGGTAGDGGFVEVSGRENLVFNGWVDASAPNGRPGTLLLDPTNIEIVASGGDPGSLDDLLAIPGSNDPKGIGTSVTRINADLINQSPNPVALQASNNITFNAPITITTPGFDFTATAGNSIFVNSNLSTNGGTVSLEAQNGEIVVRNAAIDTCPSDACGNSAFITLQAKTGVTVLDSALLSRSTSSVLFNDNQVRAILVVANEGSVLLDRAWISTSNVGGGNAGLIVVTARDDVEIRNSIAPARLDPPGIFSRGNLGGVIIGGTSLLPSLPTPKTIRILNSRINVDNLDRDLGGSGQIDAGLVSLWAMDSITLSNGTRISSSTFRQGDAGGVLIKTNNGSVSLDGSIVFSNVEPDGNGKGGNVLVDTGSLSLTNRAELQTLIRGPEAGASGGVGDAGIVFIQATDFVSLSGGSRIFSTIEEGGTNNRFNQVAGGVFNSLLGNTNQPITGSIFIDTGSLSVSGNSALTASTLGEGNAGAVVVLAREKVSLSDRGAILSGVGERANGLGGGILIGTRNLDIDGDSGLTAQTLGNGDAGLILVAADEKISVKNNSAILSTVAEGLDADSGGIFLKSRSLQVRNNSAISVDNRGTGEAGNISISARGIWLDNRSFVLAESDSGLGGNVFLNTLALILGRNSSISTTAGIQGLGGDGGNIAIGRGNQFFTTVVRRDNSVVSVPVFDDSTLLIAGKTARDNNILAQAFSGVGGNIRINAFRLQDIAERPDLLTRNDIDTQSFLGISGTVVVNALNIFPSFRVDPLPERYEAPRVSEGCDPRIRQETSQFVVTGRGGLPTDPTEVLSPDTIATSGDQSPTIVAPTETVSTKSPSINPARGWVRDADGNVRLVAHTPDPTDLSIPSFLWSIPGACNTH